MIVPVGRVHVEQIATLHCQIMTGLLTILGKKFACAVYDGYVRSGAVVGYVYLEYGLVQGFIIGSATPNELRKKALRINIWPIALCVIESVVQSPSSFWQLVAGITGRSEGRFDNSTAELTYIGVSPDARGAGVGASLLDAFNRAMWESNIGAYELSVDASNEHAIAFYEARGFLCTGDYYQYGARYRRYRLALDPHVVKGGH